MIEKAQSSFFHFLQQQLSVDLFVCLFPLFIFPPLEEDEVFCALIRKRSFQLDCLRACMTGTDHNLLNDQIKGFSSSSPAASVDPDFQQRHSPRLGEKS